MRVRSEKETDIPEMALLVQMAFHRDDEAHLIKALRHHGDIVLSLIAMHGAVMIGQVMLSRLRHPPRSLALAPLSVHPHHQGKGVGAALVQHALDRARKADWDAIFVLGEPDYYRRFGFSTEAASPIASPFPPQYFMAMEFKPGILSRQTGAIRYSKAFGIEEEI